MDDSLESTLAGDEARSGDRPAPDQDELWVRASRRGDLLSFNRLVRKWETRVYNLALRMLRDPWEAEEATQEVFLAAYRGLGRFRGASRFSSWLYRIAANRCLTRLRRQPALAEPLDESLARPAGQEADLLEAERRSSVHGALARLDPDQRVVVELKFFQDRTFDEIADILDAPVSTVKSRFYTGLAVLRRTLGTSSMQES